MQRIFFVLVVMYAFDNDECEYENNVVVLEKYFS